MLRYLMLQFFMLNFNDALFTPLFNAACVNIALYYVLLFYYCTTIWCCILLMLHYFNVGLYDFALF